jgi:hypothetical protein
MAKRGAAAGIVAVAGVVSPSAGDVGGVRRVMVRVVIGWSGGIVRRNRFVVSGVCCRRLAGDGSHVRIGSQWSDGESHGDAHRQKAGPEVQGSLQT